jgi:hypothetical protein
MTGDPETIAGLLLLNADHRWNREDRCRGYPRSPNFRECQLGSLDVKPTLPGVMCDRFLSVKTPLITQFYAPHT